MPDGILNAQGAFHGFRKRANGPEEHGSAPKRPRPAHFLSQLTGLEEYEDVSNKLLAREDDRDIDARDISEMEWRTMEEEFEDSEDDLYSRGTRRRNSGMDGRVETESVLTPVQRYALRVVEHLRKKAKKEDDDDYGEEEDDEETRSDSDMEMDDVDEDLKYVDTSDVRRGTKPTEDKSQALILF